MNKRVWAALLITLAMIFPISSFSQDSLNVFKTGEMYDHWNYIVDMVEWNDLLILSTGNEGIHIYDISDPETPEKVNSFCFNKYVRQIKTCGEYVVVQLHGNGNDSHYNSSLAILDLSDPLDINILAYHEIETWSQEGHSTAIYEAGGFIYFWKDTGIFQQIDISDPSDIVVHEYSNFDDIVLNITEVNNNLVLVHQRRIDFYHPEDMTLISSYSLEDIIIGVNCIKDSKIYFIYFGNLYTVDVSNPSEISPLYLQEAHEGIQWLFATNDLLYQVIRTDNEQGYLATRVYDISDLSNITERSYIGLGFISLRRITSSGNNEEYVYFAGSDILYSQGYEPVYISQVTIYNMTIPSYPEYLNNSIRRDFTDSYKNIHYFSNGLYYAKTILPQYVGDVTFDQITVTDVSDPTQPCELGYYDINPYHTDSYCFKEDVLYTFFSSEMTAIDLSDPSNPEEIYTYNSPGLYYRQIEIFDNYLVSHDTSFVGIYLLDNPRQEPQFQGSFTMYGLPEKVTLYEDYLIFLDRERYLALDISDPESPTVAVDTETNIASEIGKIIKQGSRLYVTVLDQSTFSTYGIEVLDISNPLVPVSETEGRIHTECIVDDLFAEGDYLYFVDGYEGFHVYNISSPTGIVEAGYYRSGSIGSSIVVNDYTAYSVDERLCVYDCQQVLGVEEGSSTTPSEFSLLQAYPNPFNPTLNVRVALPVTGELRLSVHNILGQEVAVLADRSINAGYYNFIFDGSDLSSGVYFVKASVEGKINNVQKVVLMK